MGLFGYNLYVRSIPRSKMPLTNGASFIAWRKSRGVAITLISLDTIFNVSTIGRANVYARDDGLLV